MRRLASASASLAAVLAAAACSSLGGDDLPVKPPPLADMEEPVALHEEPRDEDTRRTLPLGAFTGVTVGETRRMLDEAAQAAPGVRVARVVENSPGDAAGIEEDDLVLEATVAGGVAQALRWPSEWRRLELETAPGSDVEVLLDRAGDERRVTIRTVARVRPAERAAAERFREDRRVGVVLRTATEVEARGAGLGPGGGAVIAGLSAHSPWRDAGMRFGDLVVSVHGRAVAHPQSLLDAIREAKPGTALDVVYMREGERVAADLPVTRREQEVTKVSIPFVYSYESARGVTETSIGAGAIRVRSTSAAWEWRLLWFFTFSGGDADRLEEVPE